MAQPQIHDGQRAALALPGALEVPSEPGEVMGVPVLRAACPKCGHAMTVSGGEGRAFCRGCGALLHFLEKK